MNVRPALPPSDDVWIDEPITDAEWDAMTPAERAFIKQGFDEIDRGAFIPHAEMKREFQRMREKYSTK
jgi:predicted transcriptional regulator